MEQGSEHEAGPATPRPQHTPGPWHYDPEHGEVVSFVERPFPELSGRYIVAETVELSNGPLIAASPETLQALSEVTHALETAAELIRDVDPEAAEELDSIVGRGMDQIAKAEGREQ